MSEIERIDIVIIRHGNGPESERCRKVSFLRPEKIAACREDPGVLGAVLEDAARELRADEPTGLSKVPR